MENYAAANYARTYLGQRPKLQPNHMRRVGGGYKSDRKSESEMMDEIALLYDTLERERKEKESLRAAKAKAEHLVESHQQHHASANELANAVAVASEQVRSLQASLSQSQAALAERGISLDAALERVATLEAEKSERATSTASAIREAEVARYDAGLSEAAAAEREHQLEVLIVALKERTSEVERLGGEVKLLTQKHSLAVAHSEDQSSLYQKALEECTNRAAEVERSLRQTMSQEERRHEAERQALKAEIERSNVRATSASSLADSLREELAALKAHARTVRRRSAQPPHPHPTPPPPPSTSLLDSPLYLPTRLPLPPPSLSFPFPTPAPLSLSVTFRSSARSKPTSSRENSRASGARGALHSRPSALSGVRR